MQIELIGAPAATVARVTFAAGEMLTAEVGAMIAMSSGLQVATASKAAGGKGGILKGLKRMLSGESFFLNTFTATTADQQLIVGPTLIGDVVHHKLTGGSLIVQKSSWLASSAGIEIDTSFQGLGAGLFSGESMFWVKCTGTGDLLLNSFGAIYPVDVVGGYTVDTGHIVAFEESLKFKIGKAGKSLIGSMLGGEGLVCKFEGNGKLYCQTHNPPSFGSILGAQLKPRSS